MGFNTMGSNTPLRGRGVGLQLLCELFLSFIDLLVKINDIVEGRFLVELYSQSGSMIMIWFFLFVMYLCCFNYSRGSEQIWQNRVTKSSSHMSYSIMKGDFLVLYVKPTLDCTLYNIIPIWGCCNPPICHFISLQGVLQLSNNVCVTMWEYGGIPCDLEFSSFDVWARVLSSLPKIWVEKMSCIVILMIISGVTV